MKFLLINSLCIFAFFNSPHVFTDCFRIEQKQAWTDFDAQWPILWGNGKVYIQQMRKSKTRRGVETNIYQSGVTDSARDPGAAAGLGSNTK